jgi:hypothetical protein
MDIRKMQDEPVVEYTPFLGEGSYLLEVTEVGRVYRFTSQKSSIYFKFKVLESDNMEADQRPGSVVEKQFFETSFSLQKDLKLVVSSLTKTAVSELDWKEVALLFCPEDDEYGVGSGSESLKGLKVHTKSEVRPTKAGGTWVNHKFTAAQ